MCLLLRDWWWFWHWHPHCHTPVKLHSNVACAWFQMQQGGPTQQASTFGDRLCEIWEQRRRSLWSNSHPPRCELFCLWGRPGLLSNFHTSKEETGISSQHRRLSVRKRDYTWCSWRYWGTFRFPFQDMTNLNWGSSASSNFRLYCGVINCGLWSYQLRSGMFKLTLLLNFVQIRGAKDADVQLELKADEKQGSHFLLIEMPLAWWIFCFNRDVNYIGNRDSIDSWKMQDQEQLSRLVW